MFGRRRGRAGARLLTADQAVLCVVLSGLCALRLLHLHLRPPVITSLWLNYCTLHDRPPIARCHVAGGVVAELCPLGYCTDSYRRLSGLVGLEYMRWTNSIAANAREGYDTVVDPAQFVALMKRAASAWDWRAQRSLQPPRR